MQQKTDAQLQCLNNNNNSSQSTSLHTLQQHQPQQQNQQKRLSDVEDVGGRSDEWCSESSSGNQLRQPLIKGRTFITANKHRKFTLTPASSNTVLNDVAMKTDPDDACKKPLIAKWKTGVRIQNTATPNTPDSKGKFLFKWNSIFEI